MALLQEPRLAAALNAHRSPDIELLGVTTPCGNAEMEVLAMIAACNIRNFTIFLKEPENLLFSYFEYHGNDYAADAAKMAADPKTQEWWSLCMPMQAPLATRKEGEWWAEMENVFHVD